MGLTVCPAAVVAAPVELVWRNLVEWERYSDWFDASLHAERSEPGGPAAPGQVTTFAGKALGRTLRFTFTVEGVDPLRHQIDLDALFPFPLKLRMKPHVTCTPIDASSCRVQYG